MLINLTSKSVLYSWSCFSRRWELEWVQHWPTVKHIMLKSHTKWNLLIDYCRTKVSLKKKIWLLKVHWATMVVFTPGIFAADRIRVRLCECTPRSIDWLAWFCRTMVHLRSSYVITNMHGERSVTHHIFFFYYYFGAITSSRYYAQQRTFPCHSWYTCVVETHDTVIG